MARRKLHSRFSDRLQIRVDAFDGATDADIAMRNLVALLEEKRSLGIIRDFVMTAILEKFTRDQAGASLDASGLAKAGQPVAHQPAQPDPAPVVAGTAEKRVTVPTREVQEQNVATVIPAEEGGVETEGRAEKLSEIDSPPPAASAPRLGKLSSLQVM